MPTFSIIEAKAYHCGQIIRALRSAHRDALMRLGAHSHRELRSAFDTSSYRKAWLVDGRLAGLGGVSGPLLSSSGQIWLALTDEATRYPKQIVREARRQIDEICRVKRELTTLILPDDEASYRFATFLGFKGSRRKLVAVGGGQALPMVLRPRHPVYHESASVVLH